MKQFGRRALRAAQRLFLRLALRGKKKELAEIIYPQRFGAGRCIIGIIIPAGEKNLEKIHAVGEAHQRYHYKPAIISSKRAACLRLIFRFQNIESSEGERVLLYAKMLGEWVTDTFGTEYIISPSDGLVNALWRLEALPQ